MQNRHSYHPSPSFLKRPYKNLKRATCWWQILTENNGWVLKFDCYFCYHTHTRARYKTHNRSGARHTHVIAGSLSSSSSGPVIEWKVQASTDNVKCCHSALFDDTGIIPFHSSIHPSSTASSLSGVAYPQMHVLLLWEEAAVHPQRCRKNMQTTEKSPLAPGDSDLCSFHSLLAPWMCRVNLLLLLLLLCCMYARDWPINLVEEVLRLQYCFEAKIEPSRGASALWNYTNGTMIASQWQEKCTGVSVIQKKDNIYSQETIASI